MLNVKGLREILCKDINKSHLEKDLYVELPDGTKALVECIEWDVNKATLLCDFSKIPASKKIVREYDSFDIFLDMVKAHAQEFNGILPSLASAVLAAYQLDRAAIYDLIEATDSSDSKTETISALASELVMWVMRDNSEWSKKPEWIAFDEGR